MHDIDLSNDVCFIIKSIRDAEIIFAFLDSNNQRPTYDIPREDRCVELLKDWKRIYCITSNNSGYEFVDDQLYSEHYIECPTFMISRVFDKSDELLIMVALGFNPFRKCVQGNPHR